LAFRLSDIGSWFKPRPPACKPRIFDVCVLFNEIDLLEIRIGELWDVVDHFVVIEANLTFAGRSKPFFFEAHRNRFERFAEKITYYPFKPGEFPNSGNLSPETMRERFALEARQRDAAGGALAQLGAANDDVILLCDVDEIPRPDAVLDLDIRLRHNRFCVFELRNHRGYMNSLSDRALNGVVIVGPVAARWRTVRRLGAHEVRRGKLRAGHVLEKRDPRWNYVQDGGWHLSSMGGAEAFWVKAQNFAHIHDPYRVVTVPDEIRPLRVFEGPVTRQECARLQAEYLASGGDPHFSPLEYDEFRIEQDIPAYMRREKQRFRRYFFFTDLGAQSLAVGGVTDQL
jgi:beta-1,4-mannosyl-glycoprotein beta-1,4-N-acetylglucosaminyltransferase